MEINNEPHQYQWIINEGLLRDEGTLYGIAGANTQEKVEAIRDFYRIRKAAAQTRREQLEKEIGELQSKSSAQGQEGGDAESRGDVINVVPMTMQLSLYIAICFFNFYLEVYWLSPAIHSFFICVGLYLFGLFSVFMGRSIMYNAAGSLVSENVDGGRREAWKIYFEEFAIPVMVSLFIAILPAGAYPLSFSVIAGLVFFLLFLLGGKGLVNTMFRARVEWGRWMRVLRKRKEDKRRDTILTMLREQLSFSMASLEELNGEEDYRINVFNSEYKLAFQGRQLDPSISVKKLA